MNKIMRLFALSLIFLAQNAQAEKTAIGKVIEISGLAKSTTLKSLTNGSVLYKGDHVITRQGAMVRALIDNDIAIQIGPNSDVVIEEKAPKQTSAKVLSGMLLSMVKPQADSSNKKRYQVHAGKTVMGVRGTTFFVKEEKKKPTFFCACNGKIALNHKGKESVITSEHHDTSLFLDDKGEAKAPMGADHSDNDGAALLKILEGAGK